MTAALNILVLHRLGDPQKWRQSMVEKELCLPKFAPGHNYLVHDFWLPLPEYVEEITFDAIILTQTFLGARQDPAMRARVVSAYGSLLYGTNFKIALPQDDYTCSRILDDWLTDWQVNLTYPVCVNDWDVLYPRYSKAGGLRQGYTGYISDEMVNKTASRRSIQDRSIDVAYRAANLSPVFGRLGQIKTEYGDRFLTAAQGLPLKMDVSTRPKDMILGTCWYEFVQNTRCMLGVNSGSNLLDPYGTINECVFQYLQRYPKATYEEVEAACFPDQDGCYEFTTISPRNLECALFGTAQVLAPGAYGCFMDAREDFIPLEPDMSDFPEVATLIRDHSYLQSMADRCRDKVLSFTELRYSQHVAELIDEIRTNTRVTDAERAKGGQLIQHYQLESARTASSFWWKRRMLTKARQSLGDAGLRRFKHWFKNLANG